MKQWWRWLVVVVLLLSPPGLSSTAAEEEVQGTTAEELAGLELPSPSNVTVALLPFWDYKNLERHVNDCREVLTRRFSFQGFCVMNPALVTAVVLQDRELEPGEPLRRTDACRLGAALGADWAVYGNILQLEAYWKQSFFGRRKKAKVSIKLSIVDVATGDILFWRQRFDTSGGTGGWTKKATSLERTAVDVCIEQLLTELLAVLPPHEQPDELGVSYAPLQQEVARQAYQDDPTLLNTALVYGQSLLCYRKFAEAEDTLRAVANLHDDNADALFWHGVSLYTLSQIDEAKGEWERALRLDPEHQLISQWLEIIGPSEESEAPDDPGE